MKQHLIYLSLMLCLSCASQAQDTECRDSNSKLQASAKAFAAADSDLNKAWKAVKPALSAAQFETVLERQRAWIEYRDVMSATSALGRPSDSSEALQCAAFDETRADMTQRRTAYLKGLVQPVKEWSGSYSDGFGGLLLIEQSAEGIKFALTVVRSEAHHTGDISGVATLKGTAARFDTSVPDLSSDKEDATQPASLTMTRVGQWLNVEGENTGYFHGARAYFDGEYVRVAPLSAKDRGDIATAIRNN